MGTKVERCCGFGAMRCCLILLNVFYIAISLFLIGLVIAARVSSYFTNVPILVGIAVCATLLCSVAILGLVAAIKHHQVSLFFYMLILATSGVIMFSVSVAALAIPKSFRDQVLLTTWQSLSSNQKSDLQESLDCCGFDLKYRWTALYGSDGNCTGGHPSCNTDILIKKCCSKGINGTTPTEEPIAPYPSCSLQEPVCFDCQPCYNSWEKAVSSGVLAAGSFGLIFSLTQIVGIVLTFRFRNLKDPNANPSSFL